MPKLTASREKMNHPFSILHTRQCLARCRLKEKSARLLTRALLPGTFPGLSTTKAKLTGPKAQEPIASQALYGLFETKKGFVHTERRSPLPTIRPASKI